MVKEPVNHVLESAIISHQNEGRIPQAALCADAAYRLPVLERSIANQ